MVEVFNITVATHEQYARAQEEIQAFQKQYHLPPSGGRYIAAQAKVLDFIPKYPASSLLLQTFIKKTWARFAIPRNYHAQRFLSSHVAPSLGPAEKQDADIEKINAYIRRQKEQEKDKRDEQEAEDEAETLITLLDKGVKETNEMVDFVFARMHQFVQA